MSLLITDVEATFNQEPNHKQNIIFAWKTIANKKQITVEDTVFYILLRALVQSDLDFLYVKLDAEILDEADTMHEAETHLKEAFTPISNKTKLINGRKPYDTPQRILASIASPYQAKYRHTAAVRMGINLTTIGDENLRLLAGEIDV